MLGCIRAIARALTPHVPHVLIIDDATAPAAADETESRVYLNAAADNIRAIAGRVCDRVADADSAARGKGVIT